MALENKRIHMRIRVNLPAEVYDVLNGRGLLGKIIDISAGGVALVAAQELSIDTPISLTFEFEGIKFDKIAADVVRQIQKGDLYYLGIAFFQINVSKQEELERMVRKVHSLKERGMQRGKL